MNNRHYELRKWLILNFSLNQAEIIYELIKDFSKDDIELYKTVCNGCHIDTLKRMDFVKGKTSEYTKNALKIMDLLEKVDRGRDIRAEDFLKNIIDNPKRFT